MKRPKKKPAPAELRTTVPRGHIAGICESLGFNYDDVRSVHIDYDGVTVEAIERNPGNLPTITTHEFPIDRPN